MHYNSRIAKWFPWFTVACFILAIVFVAFNVLREIPLDVEKVHNCQVISCVTVKYHLLEHNYAKFGIGGLNVLGSCYLIFAIKRNNSEKLKNDVVKFTITMDIFLDVIPTIASFRFLTIFMPSVYIGPLISSLVFLNVAVCSVYYSWRLTRKTNGLWIKICRVQQVSPTITTSITTST
ncbi:hypothetical protein DdX_14595 [Ditylenchus destructor]|uniref:Uncharacterized protein n=1 Tax=Ditylenchus destructor TaxID=166010 RepID=A0AAD4MUE7_9BILA|nr:hypothetical protein DdX_14595 [Ditylenchus destructor]